MSSVGRNPTSQPGDNEEPFCPAKPANEDFKNLLLGTLDRLGCGGLILDRNNGIIGTNQVAVEILKGRSKLPIDKFELVAAVKALLRSIEPAPGDTAWVSAWQERDHSLAIFPVPSGDSMVLIIVDISTPFQTRATRLKRMFGTTSEDFKLASGIAFCLSPTDLAEKLGFERPTARRGIDQDKDRQAS